MRSLGLLATSWTLAGLALLVLAMRLFHPSHHAVAIAVYAISWLPFFYSLWRKRDLWSRHGGRFKAGLRQLRAHALLLLGLLLTGYALAVLFPLERSPLLAHSERELAEQLERDAKLLVYLGQRLDDSIVDLGHGNDAATPRDAADRARLREAWRDVLDSMFELDLLKRRYRTFYQINGFTRPLPHARAFLNGYAAHVAQYVGALEVTKRLGADTSAIAVLNEASGSWGYPGDSFTLLQKATVHPDGVLQLNAGRAYLSAMDGRLGDRQALLGRVRRALGDIDRTVGEQPGLFIDNPLGVLERTTFHGWFPVQKRVAEGMSVLRAARRDYFITHEQLAEHRAALAPGDLLFERREWHVTNLGIPGFWTHAALYIGTPPELDVRFAGLPALAGQSASSYLRARHPDAMAILDGQDEHGFPRAVIEALGAGVVVTSLEASGHADSLAALRPRVADIDTLRAVEYALAQVGRPYDYDFDFATDDALVCSELVVKAYQGAPITFETRLLNGRIMTSPNEIVAAFARRPDDERQLDFVLFLDGSRESGAAHAGDEAALRESWKRPKWHIIFN